MNYLYQKLLKPLLFQIDPELAHESLGFFLEKGELIFGSSLSHVLKLLFTHTSSRLLNTIQDKTFQLNFSGPVGLAAGFDKSGSLYPALSHFGFNFIECGTFTPLPQEGNPKPRLFRFPEHSALVNRMGFNNPGIEEAQKTFSKQNKSITRGINIGKGKHTPIETSFQDYELCAQKLAPYGDYLAINISSPNTPDLRKIQKEPRILEDILFRLKKYSKPIFVKLAPDLEFNEIDSIMQIILKAEVMGVILTNTTIDKSILEKSHPHSKELEGGLSGKPLRSKANEIIKHSFLNYGDKIKIIGVGGILSGEDALEKILLGASLIQVYTGFIYQGPTLALQINKTIDYFLKKENKNINEVIGIKARAT